MPLNSDNTLKRKKEIEELEARQKQLQQEQAISDLNKKIRAAEADIDEVTTKLGKAQKVVDNKEALLALGDEYQGKVDEALKSVETHKSTLEILNSKKAQLEAELKALQSVDEAFAATEETNPETDSAPADTEKKEDDAKADEAAEEEDEETLEDLESELSELEAKLLTLEGALKEGVLTEIKHLKSEIAAKKGESAPDCKGDKDTEDSAPEPAPAVTNSEEDADKDAAPVATEGLDGDKDAEESSLAEPEAESANMAALRDELTAALDKLAFAETDLAAANEALDLKTKEAETLAADLESANLRAEAAEAQVAKAGKAFLRDTQKELLARQDILDEMGLTQEAFDKALANSSEGVQLVPVAGAEADADNA